MRTVFIKAKTKDEILDGVNNYPDALVFGISPSGNIYFIKNEEINQATIEEVKELTGKDASVLTNAVNRVLSGEIDLVDLDEENKDETSKDKTIREDATPEKQDNNELVTSDESVQIPQELKSEQSGDKYEQLEQRVAKLENLIKNLPDEIISELRSKLGR